MIHNKQSYIKSIALEKTCCGSIFKRIHKKLGDYLLKKNAPKKKNKRKSCGSSLLVFNCLNFIHPNPTDMWKQIKPQGNNCNVHISRFQIPSKLIKTQRLLKKLPTKNTQHHGHLYEIQNITYILHPLHNFPLIFYYAYVRKQISN